MYKISPHRLLSLLLLVMMIASLAACTGRPGLSNLLPEQSGTSPEESAAPPEAQVQEKDIFFINTLTTLRDQPTALQAPKRVLAVAEKKALNSDSVGWLTVPNTTIDDVVLWYPQDRNDFYYRRNFEKRYSDNGCYYADFRNTFDASGLKSMSTNTVIYGHSMKDNPDSGLFSGLKHYLDPLFAKANPYVFFTVGEEDRIWEVFAVFYATIDLPYNRPDMSRADYTAMLEECRKRSIYDYEAQVGAEDKIITLSTCTYSLPGGPDSLPYPNNFRYVVMARLVDNADKPEAAFSINPNPKAP